MSNKMNNKFTKTFILSRLLLLFALVCPLSVLAQATLTPVAELTLNEDGTTYTVTYKAVEGTPTYVTEGVGTYKYEEEYIAPKIREISLSKLMDHTENVTTASHQDHTVDAKRVG